jgi:preprotein translocase subunit SecD
MQNTWPIRMAIAFFMLGIAGFYLYPTYKYFSLSEEEEQEVRRDKAAFSKFIPSWAPDSHIVPGLDLQGGIHMVLGVDLDKAISDRAQRSASRLRGLLDENEIAYKKVDHLAEEGSGDRLRAVFSSPEDKQKYDSEVANLFQDLVMLDEQPSEILFRVHPDYAAQLKREAVDQTIKTIRNRIDKMHVTEPSIAKRGDDQIQIQLPGYDDPEEAKSLIGRTAQLEFQMCADENTFMRDLEDIPEYAELVTSGYRMPSGANGNDIYLLFPEKHLAELQKYLAKNTPSGLLVKYGRIPDTVGEETRMRTFTLHAAVELTGDDLVDARVAMGSPENPRPSVSLDFSPAGTKIFADLTTRSVGKRLAIVLEDIVDSAPVIQTPITGGSAQITMGQGSRQEMIKNANQLALVLKAGALPAPVQFREERSVGASLGEDAVEAGKKACLVGAILVFLFMMGYYLLGGCIAVIGIIFNIAFVLATISWLNGTVTLPGLAGLLLTVGMAVDANIIIMERIREELRAGKTPRSAVAAGYDSAFSAIIDANVTTFIAGFVLWQYGTGPIQNFATTLLIGTISSVVSAIFITRVFFDMYTARKPETIRI